MIASAHVVAGLVAGMASARVTDKRIQRIAIAFGFGILSHVVFDAIPHSDYGKLERATVVWITLGEGVGVCLLAAMILRRRVTPHWPEYLFAGLVGSVILDAKFFVRVFLPLNIAASVQRYGDHIHSFFHADRLSHPIVGTAIEIVTTILLLAILSAFPRIPAGGDRVV